MSAHNLVCVHCSHTFVGRAHNAKTCSVECRSAYNKQKESEWFKQKWASDPAWKTRKKNYRKKWDADNGDRCREYARRSYHKRKEVCRAKHKRWRESHKEHLYAKRLKYYHENRDAILERSRSVPSKERQRFLRSARSDLIAVLRAEMPELLKELGL